MAAESYHPSIYTPDLQENPLPGQEAPAGLVTPELALSAKLIMDTATTLATSEFQDRFKADPSLPGLHPLAKACAYLELDNAAKHLTKELINSALQTCWLFYVPEVEDEGIEINNKMDAIENVTEIENVTHAIGLCEFESTGTLYWGSAQYSEAMGSVSFKEAHNDLLEIDLLQPAALFSLWKQHNPLGPNGSIDDSGCYIGTIEFQLVRIGSVPVVCSKIDIESTGEVDFDDSGALFFDDDENFCWLNLLSQEQARMLGIPENKKQKSEGTGKSKKYPAWVDRKWAKENGWFSTDDLENSYSEGRISPKRISFLIGQDENWAPQPLYYPRPEEDAEFYEEEPEADPPTPALFAWEIKIDDASVVDTLANVLAKVKKLVTTG